MTTAKPSQVGVHLEGRPQVLRDVEQKQQLFKQAMEEAAKPYRELQESFARLQEQIRDSFSAIPKMYNEENSILDRVKRSFTLPQQLDPVLNRLSLWTKNSEILDREGWLPHYTMPLWNNEDLTIVPDISGSIIRHYTENWEEFCHQIYEGFTVNDLDKEAQNCFREALVAHRTGLYRCVCRVLFPEIERVIRLELNGKVGQAFTSLKDIKDAAFQLSPREISEHGFYALQLFEKFRDHFYEKIQTEEKREEFALSAIPNRHASIHGLIVYKTYQNSMNTIFLADFIFQVIGALKRHGKLAKEG